MASRLPFAASRPSSSALDSLFGRASASATRLCAYASFSAPSFPRTASRPSSSGGGVTERVSAVAAAL